MLTSKASQETLPNWKWTNTITLVSKFVSKPRRLSLRGARD